jgi:glycosyltransferase involved in cell wall biosynthesis
MAYKPLLEANGVQVTFRRGQRHRPIDTTGFDVVWLRRLTLDAGTLSGIKIPMVFDFDDAVYCVHRTMFRDTVNRASVVLAGSQRLAEEAQSEGAKNVEILRTGVDVSAYPTATHDYDPLCVWTGSSSTVPFLEALAPDLTRSNIRVRVICDKFPKSLASENVAWDPTSERSALQGTSLGLAPLPDIPYTRGKCAFKIVQYMAAGLPVVATGVGANKEMFSVYSCQGYCTEKNSEIVPLLPEMLSDPAHMKALGGKNRLLAEQHFDLSVLFPRLLKALRGST